MTLILIALALMTTAYWAIIRAQPRAALAPVPVCSAPASHRREHLDI